VRLFGIAPALLVALVLAQVRTPARPSRGKADAGDRPIYLGTDPPGRLRPASADAGTDGGPADAGPDEVHRELQQLKTRLDRLEQERQMAAQQTAQQIQQLAAEVQQLRQQIADAEARRETEEQQRAARRASMQAGVDAVGAAQQRLTSGDTSIEAELDRAQASFTGQALLDVQAAREALRNRDLLRARALLGAAALDAQAGR
jgi:TolA-binding protein